MISNDRARSPFVNLDDIEFDIVPATMSAGQMESQLAQEDQTQRP